MVTNGELRDENRKLWEETEILRLEIKSMKEAMDRAIGHFLPFCDVSINANDNSVMQTEISHQEISHNSSALLSGEGMEKYKLETHAT